jgi:serine protease AprX
MQKTYIVIQMIDLIKPIRISFLGVLILIMLLGNISPVIGSTWQSKVDRRLIKQVSYEEDTKVEFLVYLIEQADLRAADKKSTKLEKGLYAFEHLREVAERTQQPIIAVLEAHGVEYRAYWIANIVWVQGGMNIIELLAKRPDVERIYGNPWVKLEEPIPSEPSVYSSSEGVPWNIQLVNADDVWAMGVTGQGVVIGGQDTGYEWDHPALINQYRGWDGSSVDHNYNWHDAIHQDDPNTSAGNPCGFNSQVPCDDDIGGHGTHTMGIMVGDDGGENQIGMAVEIWNRHGDHLKHISSASSGFWHRLI